MLIIKLLQLLVTVAVVTCEVLVGGVTKLAGRSLEDAEATLQNSLTKLSAGEGPQYQLERMISATHQVVSGCLYKYEVELKDKDNRTKQCKVDIWSRPWLENGIEVTFDCENSKKFVRKHSA